MKKTLVTMTMAIVIALSSTIANANGGILIGDFNDKNGQQNCGIIIGDLGGILIGDFGGILIGDLVGKIVKGISKDNPCQERVDSGILIGD